MPQSDVDQRALRAARDPEVLDLMRDPEVLVRDFLTFSKISCLSFPRASATQAALADFQADAEKASKKYSVNKAIMAKLDKLVASGAIQVQQRMEKLRARHLLGVIGDTNAHLLLQMRQRPKGQRDPSPE